METFGSSSSSGFKPTQQSNQSGERGSKSGSCLDESMVGDSEDQEVQSPLKNDRGGALVKGAHDGPSASRRLDLQGDEARRCQQPRKRKSKVATPVTQTPDLNIPLGASSALVPAGLVNSRVSQLDAGADSGGSSMLETLKKQKRGTNNNNAGSVAVAESIPRRAQ